MGSRCVRRAVDAITEQLQKIPVPPAERFVIEDGSVAFSVLTKDNTRIRVTCHILELSEYPNSPALLQCEDANNSTYQEALNEVCERYFSDRAPVEDVVGKVRW